MWDKMVVKCPQKYGRIYDHKGATSITNWHLPRALPMTEQQRHLPSASVEIEPHAANHHGDIRPSWLTKNPFVNWVLHGIERPLHQNLIYWLSPTAALEQSLRAIWDGAFQASVLILPKIKLNSQLSSCTSFFSQQQVPVQKKKKLQNAEHPFSTNVYWVLTMCC